MGGWQALTLGQESPLGSVSWVVLSQEVWHLLFTCLPLLLHFIPKDACLEPPLLL